MPTFPIAQSPFVVAIKEGRPQIRVISEGTAVQVRPLADQRGMLRLDFAVTSSKIRGVENATLSTTVFAGKGNRAIVQVPEVETARVEGGLELPWNHWLLLGGLEHKNQQGKPEDTVVMVRAEKVDTASPKEIELTRD